VLTCGDDRTARLWRGRDAGSFFLQLGTARTILPSSPEQRAAVLAELERVVAELTRLRVGDDGGLDTTHADPEADPLPAGGVASASWEEGAPADRTTWFLKGHLDKAAVALRVHAQDQCKAGRAARAVDAARRACAAAGRVLRLTPRSAPAWEGLAQTQGLLGRAELQAGHKAEGERQLREAMAILIVLEEKCGDAAKLKARKAGLLLNRSFYHLFLGEGEQAVRAARRCHDLHDKGTEFQALTNLAHGHLLLGQFAEGERVYKDNAARLVGSHSFAWWVLDDFAWFRRTGVRVPGADRIEPLMREAVKGTKDKTYP
jgi:hypothetical protein